MKNKLLCTCQYKKKNAIFLMYLIMLANLYFPIQASAQVGDVIQISENNVFIGEFNGLKRSIFTKNGEWLVYSASIDPDTSSN